MEPVGPWILMAGFSFLKWRKLFLVAAIIPGQLPGSIGLVSLDQNNIAVSGALHEQRRQNLPGAVNHPHLFQRLPRVGSSGRTKGNTDTSIFFGRLNGGASDSGSISKFQNFLSAIKNALWSCVVCFVGLFAVGFTMMIYFYSIAFFLSHGGADSLSQATIALFSLTGSVVGSLAGGACVGHLAASNPARHAALVGAAFVILQLRQIAFFEGMPIWYTLANLLSYVPCTVYSARWTARRRVLRQNPDDSAKPKPDEAAVHDSTPNEAGAAPTGAEAPAADGATAADAAQQAPTTDIEGGNGVQTEAATTPAA